MSKSKGLQAACQALNPAIAAWANFTCWMAYVQTCVAGLQVFRAKRYDRWQPRKTHWLTSEDGNMQYLYDEACQCINDIYATVGLDFLWMFKPVSRPSDSAVS